MAQPHPQTGLGQPAGAAVQSPLPQRQVTSGAPVVATLNRPLEQAAAPAPAPVPRQAAVQNQSAGEREKQGSDWGLAPEKPGFSRENKFVLFVLLILVVVFSYVIFRNFQKKGTQGEIAGTNPGASEKKESAEKKDKETNESKIAEANQDSAGNGKKTSEKSGNELQEDDPNLEKNDTPELADQSGKSAFEGTIGDEFEEASQVPTRRTSHRGTQPRGTQPRGTQHRGAEHPSVEETDVDQEIGEPEVAVVPAKQKRPAADVEAEELTTIEEEPVEMTPATRPRLAQTRTDDLQEGSAEALDVPAQATPNSNEFTATEPNEFAVDSKFDANLEQTGGTADKGLKHRTGKKAHPEVDQDELAQAETPMLPDESIPGTTPRRNPSHRTGPRVAGPPDLRSSNAGGVPLPADSDDEKYGGMVPQDVGRRPAPRGNFDPQAQPLVENNGEYVIRPNDNYWRISRKVYGTARYFDALRLHNETVIQNPKQMKVGIRISTPSRDLLEQQYRDILPAIPTPKPPGAVFDSPTAPKAPGYFVEPGNQPAYRVGPTDTLSSISQRTLGRSSRWDEIYELNRDRIASHDELSQGMILRLPPDASQPRLVVTPAVNH